MTPSSKLATLLLNIGWRSRVLVGAREGLTAYIRHLYIIDPDKTPLNHSLL